MSLLLLLRTRLGQRLSATVTVVTSGTWSATVTADATWEATVA